MGARFIAVALLLICCGSMANTQSKPKVEITIESDIYHYAQAIIQDRPIASITHFKHKTVQRDVVEFILIQQALLLGGLEIEFDFKLGNYDARNIILLEKGLLLMSFDSVWLSQATAMSDAVYISEPVINKGQYMAGLFTAKGNEALHKVAQQQHLHDVSIVSSHDWPVDWQTLQTLQPKSLLHESDWISMAKMVSRGWVDAMLVPFNTSFPFEYTGEGYHLVAVPNIKVALNDSRHFLVSKKHPLGAQTFAALQKGLAILKESGQIEKAYIDAGFLNPLVKDWPVIKVD